MVSESGEIREPKIMPWASWLNIFVSTSFQRFCHLDRLEASKGPVWSKKAGLGAFNAAHI
jgi:hypothetical protein